MSGLVGGAVLEAGPRDPPRGGPPSPAIAMIGASVPRIEDARLVTGHGRYVDDLAIPGALHLAIVRSPHAHARVRGAARAAALACPGVVGVFCLQDLPELVDALPSPPEPAMPIRAYRQSALAGDTVRFAGEPVAAVLAEDRYAAADGAAHVVVAYEPLPAVIGPEAALDPAAPLVHPEWGSNLAGTLVLETGDVDRAMADSAIVVSRRFVFHRLSAVPLEPRAVAARWDSPTRTLQVWSTTQVPYGVREYLARALGLRPSAVRVVAPDVGGGFGTKGVIYPEELIAAALARRLGRPVRWVDTRRESFVSSSHGGDQIHAARLGARADGTFTALEDDFVLDGGAYLPRAGIVPSITSAHLMGLYRFVAFRSRARAVATHKVPNSPYRGAGRSEAAFVLERLIDVAARELRRDPVEIRRQNLLRPDELPASRGVPYRDGVPIVYDSGDYPGLLDTVVARADYAGFRNRQRRAREAGRWLGCGVATYNEGTAIGPQEGAAVAVEDDGSVTVTIGTPSQGQGHETTLAQVCAERLGVPLERVAVVAGDTDRFPVSLGTYASRVGVVVGNAVAAAADAVRDKAAWIAAARLECDPGDVVVVGGQAQVRGAPDRRIPVAELAVMARRPEVVRKFGEPGLAAVRHFLPETVTWAPGAHLATVEVDRETGRVSVLSYHAVHDVGREINPPVVEGQVHGGVVQGLGAALSERIVYGEAGQVLTATLMEYGLPRADDVPAIDVARRETASPRNPLGVKGAGEGAAVPPPVVIANAIADALAGEITEVPVHPETILALTGTLRR